MNDLEVKRKQLETAKRIRDNGYACQSIIPYVSCINNHCPSNGVEEGCLFSGSPAKWDAFISTREAELAALEETPDNTASTVCPVCQGKGTVSVKVDSFHSANHYHQAYTGEGVITHGGKSYPVAPVGTGMDILAPSPTLDDFALALIQGGYYVYLAEQGVGDDDDREETVYGAAELLKKAADRRREA